MDVRWSSVGSYLIYGFIWRETAVSFRRICSYTTGFSFGISSLYSHLRQESFAPVSPSVSSMLYSILRH